MTDEFNSFYRELKRTIQHEINVCYPIIGVIVETTPNKEYCSVETDEGIISNIPAHGLPVVGDSAVIHFVNGNYQQPVCDCARRLPPDEQTLTEMYKSRCFNYLNNGDFHNNSKGYKLDNNDPITIYEGTDFTGIQKAGILKLGEEVTIQCDISQCDTDYFKFQCVFQGNSMLAVGVKDADTDEIIPPLPLTLEKQISIWENPNGRFGWSFNKEAYTKNDTETINISLANIHPEKLKQIQVDGTYEQEPTTLLIDALLVYDENGDTDYYNSVQDLIDSQIITST